MYWSGMRLWKKGRTAMTRLDEIRARCEAFDKIRNNQDADVVTIDFCVETANESLMDEGYMPEFAALLSNAIRDIPYLLSEIDKLRAELAEANRRAEAAVGDMYGIFEHYCEAWPYYIGPGCKCCKHYPASKSNNCDRCANSNGFEWRGPQSKGWENT